MAKISFSVGFPVFTSGVPASAWFTSFAQKVESFGFDGIFHGERVLGSTPMLSPIAALTHFAAVTSRLRVGTNVLLLPLHQPVHAAKIAASIDYLSNGRFVLGVAPGGDFPNEFEACAVPHKQRGGRTEEAISLMRRLWTENDVCHEGKYYVVHNGTILPKPVQAGGPPVWIGGRADWAIACAARLGDAWVPSYMPAARFKQSWQRLTELAAAAGRDPAAITPAVTLPFYLANSFEEGWPIVARSMGAAYGRSYDAATLAKFCAIGNAEQCREMIITLYEAGVRHFVLTSQGTLDEMPDQITGAAGEFQTLLP